MPPLTINAARTVAALLSPAGDRARLSILIFHRVHEAPDSLFPEEVTAERFDRLLAALGAAFNLLPLPEAIERLRAGTLPSRPACITFDDGYRDNAEVALPILQRYGVHATFFIATGFLDGGRMWNDTLIETVRRSNAPALDLSRVGLGRVELGDTASRRRVAQELIRSVKHLAPAQREQAVAAVAEAGAAALPTNLMMSSAQVKAMSAAGMEIGAHTVSHPILASTSDDEAEREIEQGRQRLQQITGESVRLFAYPNGRPGRDYRPEHVAMVRRLGFEAALSTASGVSTTHSDIFQLPRFTPWDLSNLRFTWRAVANLRHVT